MNLYEHEGKELLRRHGIRTPKGVLLSRADDLEKAAGVLGNSAYVVKAQVLAGKRAQRGGIQFCEKPADVFPIVNRWFKNGLDGLHVETVLVEERLIITREWYVSCLYDGAVSGPVLLFSENGGTGIEEQASVSTFALDPRSAALPQAADTFLSARSEVLRDACASLIVAFFEEDARQIEINPLAEVDGQAVALDAKIALDDAALGRHPERPSYPDRAGMTGRAPTERELAARAVDSADSYQGTASTYLELDGDIAVLCSGGGASLVCMDALAANGLSPANYTEYSGNPPRERVCALTNVVLSKPGLRGLLIAGGVANFTDIKETFAGIADALDTLKPSYPIVVRRAGPNEREGMELMRACAERNGLRMELFGKETPLHEAAAVLARRIKAL